MNKKMVTVSACLLCSAACLCGCAASREEERAQSPPVETESYTEDSYTESTESHTENQTEKAAGSDKYSGKAAAEQTEKTTEDTFRLTEEESEMQILQQSVMLADYHTFRTDWTEDLITENMVMEELNRLIGLETDTSEYMTYGEVVQGDFVLLDYEGSALGEQIDSLCGEEEEIELGCGELPEQLEDAIIGMKAGEKKQLQIAFDEWEEEDLAGKSVQMTVFVKGISKKLTWSDIDDDWVSEHTDYDSKESWRIAARENLLEESREEEENALIEKLTMESAVDLPEQLTLERVEQLKYEYEEMAKMAGLGQEDYLQTYLDTDPDSYEELLREEAAYSLRREAVVRAFITSENLDAGHAVYENYLNGQAVIYGYQNGQVFLQDMQAAGMGTSIYELFLESLAGERLLELASADGEERS